MAPLALSSHVFWVACRAAGISALILVSASIGVGLSLSGRLVETDAPGLRAAHEALSLGALAMIALHVVGLIGDSYFHPSLADVAIPFVRDYREPYMAIGIIGGWGTIILGFSYYARGRIGLARWRVLHRLTALAWVLSVIHTLGEGSDGGEAWFIVLVALTAFPTALLILMRLGSLRGSGFHLEPGSGYLPRLRRSGPS